MRLAAISMSFLGGLLLFEFSEPKPDPVPDAFNTPRQLLLIPSDTDIRQARIVTWNIERGVEFDVIARELARDPAELLLLQEVDWDAARSGSRDVAAELARRLHLNMVYGTEFEELSQEKDGHSAFIGQATLTRLPVVHSRILRFERQSGFWKPHSWIPSSLPVMQRRRGSRIALVTDLRFAGKLLVVYNVHLESRSAGPIQAAQIDEILADAAHYPHGTAVILGGDLNTKYLPGIFLHKLERQDFQSALGQRIERTHAIAMSLDWIFSRGPVRLEEGRVCKDFTGSDHYPIYADLVAR